jgi:uncharacterized protein (TIGR03437 family)
LILTSVYARLSCIRLMKHTFGIGILAVGAFCGAEARADTTISNFTINGGGISASGTITLLATATPGVDEVVGITGTFSSTSAGISGAITGLSPGSYNSNNATVGLFRYDNLYYPTGAAPGVNGNPAGGTLDDYGIEFMVAGGYVVNLFEKGTAAGFLLDDGITAAVDFRVPVTFAVTAPQPVPAITQVLNNYGLIPGGFANSGIAPGALFIIKGSDLASATSVSSLESTTGGSVLPTTLNGATVAVTVGSVTVAPAFYYAENIQLALVLPSNTPLGAGTVTVTYNNQTSAPLNVQVVASAFGFAASDGTGSGQGHAQDLSYGYYSYSRSIPPGATIRMIGSGLGADPTRDIQYVQPTAASAINALAHVYVGGLDANIFYQGPEGFPGVDEIDITIPSNAPTGCFISVVGVTAGGMPTNFLTLPIGTGACEDPAFGAGGSTISGLNGQTTVNKGTVFLDEATVPSSIGVPSTSEVALAQFQSYTGSTYGTSNSGTVSIGSCTVQESLTSNSGIAGTTTGLDAGTITITGPGGTATLASQAGVSGALAGEYLAQLASGFIPASGGTFQVTGSGGKDVGPFTTQIIYPNPVLIWTNQSADATVSRSTGVTITWNGGEPGTFVIISGSSSTGGVSGSFTCLAPVSATQFNVPGYVTAVLPAASGNLAVANYTNYGSFTATGLDTGYALGFVNYGIKATYQ